MLDTRTVAPSDRPDYWSAGIADHFFPMHVESLGPWSLEARLTGRLRHGFRRSPRVAEAARRYTRRFPAPETY